MVDVDVEALTRLAFDLAASAAELAAMATKTQLALADLGVAAAALISPVAVARAVSEVELALFGSGGMAWLADGYYRLSVEATAQVAEIYATQAGTVAIEAADVAAGVALSGFLQHAEPFVQIGRASLRSWVPEGPGVVTPVSQSVVPPPPSRLSLEALYHRSDTLTPGQMEVFPVTGADGVVRYVVLLRGMHTQFNPSVNNPAQAVKSSVQDQDAFSRAVAQAVQMAGVPAGSQIMVVGHSQGGIAAMNLAGNPDFNGPGGRYQVTNVVAAGSPIGNKVLPQGATTKALSIEHNGDLVSDLDGMREAGNSWRISYRFGDDRRLSSALDNHGRVETYIPEITTSRFSQRPDVRTYLDGAAPYMTGAVGEPRRFQLDEGPYRPSPAMSLSRQLMTPLPVTLWEEARRRMK